MTALGAIGAGAIITLGMWLRSYLIGRNEAIAGELHGKHVILEQAELANLGTLPTQLAALGPKLDQVIAQDHDRRRAIERVGGGLERAAEATAQSLKDMGGKIDDQLRILRRLESELELAKRMREEELLRVRRREGEIGRRRESED